MWYQEAVMAFLTNKKSCSIQFLLCAFLSVSGVNSLFTEESDEVELYRFVYDATTKSIYVAATDKIYKLSTALIEESSIELGPFRDNINCNYKPSETCVHPRTPVRFVPRALFIDNPHRRLIVCSTPYYGSCYKVSLNNFIPIEYIYKPVIPNDERKSVVAFVGPGINAEGVLYVGASYSTLGIVDYRNLVGFISVRNLSTLDVARREKDYSTQIDVLQQFRETFQVEFVSGFSYNGYAYFFTMHVDDKSTLTTYALRICEQDKKLHSLTEISLDCTVAGIRFSFLRDITLGRMGRRLSDALSVDPDAMFGAFTVNSSEAGDAAVCVYSMKKVEEAFQKVVRDCFSGTGRTGPSYLTGQTTCTKTDVHAIYCGENAYNQPTVGLNPIQPLISSAFKGVMPTSILTKTVNNATVAFVGGTKGRLFKLHLRYPGNSSILYGTTNLVLESPQPIKDLLVVTDDAIYALTNKSVQKLSTHNCAVAGSCSKCIVDPHCGWCSTFRRCTVKSECSSSTMWLTESCPLVTEISPSYLSRDKYTTTLVVMKVNFLPSSSQTVQCKIENPISTTTEEVEATVEHDHVNVVPKTVRCKRFTRMPIIPDRTAQLNFSLTILVDKVAWVTGTLTVYECQQFKRCDNCNSVPSLCKWCIPRHQCIPDTDASCVEQGSPSVIENATSCPRFERESGKLLLLPAGVGKTLQVVGLNIRSAYNATLKCRLKLGNEVVRVPATLTPTSQKEPVTSRALIQCPSVNMPYKETDAMKTAALDLVWGNEFELDKPANLSVNVYKCRHLVSSCGHCLLLDAAYDCTWCQGGGSGDHCRINNLCLGTKVARDETCPDPRITSIVPPGGPVKGGTVLTISGINLGKVVSDLVVTVGGTPCATVPDKYVPTESVVCRTSPVTASQPVAVLVTVNGKFTTPPFNFIYKDPVLQTLTPQKGPCAGGTHVTLRGEHLNYGSSVSVKLFDKSAPVLWRNATHLEFLTQYQPLSDTTSVGVKVDNGDELRVPIKQFICAEDITIHSVNPTAALISGGNIIDVTGTNFDFIQKPLLIVHINNNENRTMLCKKSGTNLMQCRTPDLRDLGITIGNEVSFNFGFVMDNVTELLNLQPKHARPKRKATIDRITYYADPKVQRLPKTIKYQKGQAVSIQGERVNILANFTDTQVHFGGTPGTNLNSPAKTTLTVIPPEKPLTINKDGNALVTISLGNYNAEVGYVSYTESNVGLIVGLVVGLGLLVIIVVAFLVWFFILRKKNFQRKAAPSARAVDAGRAQRAPSNSYQETRRNVLELTPLRHGENKDNPETNENVDLGDDKQFLEVLLGRIENPRIRAAAKEVYIARERLELSNLLGKGHFGRVYAATLRDVDMKNPKAVAVKTIEEQDLDQKMIEKFLQEGIAMKNFNHPHVLSLIGLCLGYKKEPMVILPFMANGDLRTYVKDQSKDFTARQLLLLAQHVAEGMAYLSSLNYIHRDLAARNCMIDENSLVKVADFGLSHELHNRDYYRNTDHKARLPIKWMALESLEDFIFTTKSDVWSFGVLMWELMTRGILPYPDVDVFETRNFLASGRRLRKPQYCPEEVYKIMMDCWQALPEARPTFTDLVNRIELLLNPTRPTGEGAENEPSYLNLVESNVQDYLKPISYDDSSTDE